MQVLCLALLAADFALHPYNAPAVDRALSQSPYSGGTNHFIVLGFFAITLRDCLFIQLFRLRRQKMDWLLALVYLFAFLALPALVNAASDKWILDLTFVQVLLIYKNASPWILVVSPLVNLAVAAVLAVITWRLVKKAYRGLPELVDSDE